MTQSEFLVHFGWLIALLVSVAVVSWVVLLLQAVFHDKRIALVGLFGSLLVAFWAIFPELVPVAVWFKAATAVVCLGFVLWFLVKNYERPVVYLPVVGLLLTTLVGYRLYQAYLLTS